MGSHDEGRWTNQNKYCTKNCPHFVLFSCNRRLPPPRCWFLLPFISIMNTSHMVPCLVFQGTIFSLYLLPKNILYEQSLLFLSSQIISHSTLLVIARARPSIGRLPILVLSLPFVGVGLKVRAEVGCSSPMTCRTPRWLLEDAPN